MSLIDDINLLLRDHTGYTGDGQGGRGALPVGDRSTARWTPDMRAFRELLKAMAQAQGDPEALQDILEQLDLKADLANSGAFFPSRDAMEAAGQSAFPGSKSLAFHPDGDYLVVRSAFTAADDPLFETSPRWGVLMRVPNDALLNAKASQADFDEALPTSAPSPAMVPLNVDAAGKVPVWLSDGDLDARGMAPGLRDKAVQDVAPKVDPGSIVPILGAGGRMLIWADQGGLVIPGMARSADLPVVPARPTIGDDKGLHRTRTKLAQIKSEVAGAKLKIAGIGDSWWQMPPIPRAFRDIAGKGIGLSGEGFRPPTGGNNIVGTGAWTRSGWTDVDGSTTGVFPYGAGPDGNCAWTDGTAATMTLTGAVATEFHIYDFQHGGAWRYRIDGGAWVTVTSDATGDFRITSITGLADGPHTLEIDTAPNAGIVSMAGIYSTRAGVSGIEILKLGNGGTTGFRMAGYTQFMPAPLAHMQPDVAVVILGTNDYRNAASPPSVYLAALQQMVAACRAAVPDMGFVFVVPPQSNGVAVNPLSAYRDILAPWVEAEGHAMISLLDRWPDFATSNGHGLWNDDLHLSYPSGATVLASDILTNLILKEA